MRPSAVGGMIVQVASSAFGEQDWLAFTGFTRTAPRDDGARLLGPLLQHPDLDRARMVWTTLGGTVSAVSADVVDVTWDGHPLVVRIRRGADAGPVGLRFAGAPPLPADPALGPAVLPP